MPVADHPPGNSFSSLPNEENQYVAFQIYTSIAQSKPPNLLSRQEPITVTSNTYSHLASETTRTRTRKRKRKRKENKSNTSSNPPEGHKNMPPTDPQSPKPPAQPNPPAQVPPRPDPTADLTTRALAAMPQDERLAAAASANQAAASASSLASTLRSKASLLTNPAERSRLMQEAYNKELEAHGNSKRARILTSGTFQGAAGGAGIGGAVGMGLGTVVGTVVGGVATLPGVLVGGLVGAGTGVIHGPWIKLTKMGGKGGEKVPLEAIEDGSVIVDKKSGKIKEVVNEEGLKKARERAEKMEKEGGGGGGGGGVGGSEKADVKERKKPRKIEMRNKPKAGDA